MYISIRTVSRVLNSFFPQFTFKSRDLWSTVGRVLVYIEYISCFPPFYWFSPQFALQSIVVSYPWGSWFDFFRVFSRNFNLLGRNPLCPYCLVG